MKIEEVTVSGVDVGTRHRQVNREKVAALVESIRAVGLLQPITVYMPEDGKVELVAGLHRLEAAKALEWPFIPAVYIDANDIDRELAEIDENLCRAELTPTEEAEHLARRKELWEARKRERNTGDSVATKRGRGQPEGFAASTAKATGKSKSGINKAVQRANEITSEARDIIRGTPLDTTTFLDKLMKQPEDQQADFARRSLEAHAEKEHWERQKAEQAERDREAKEVKERARIAVCDFLLDALSAKEWDHLIDLIEQAGGNISAKALRDWQAPTSRVAA